MLNLNTPTLSMINQIVHMEEPNVVSIYVGLADDVYDLDKARIKLKNQVSVTRRLLEESRDTAGDSKRFDQVEDLAGQIASHPFAAARGCSVGIFMGENHHEAILTPCFLEDFSIVAEHPHIVPLIEAVEDPTEFCVLALSQERVRLFRGHRSGLNELDFSRAPQRIEEVAGEEVVASNVQFHSVGKMSAGGGAIQYHGEGDPQSTEEEHLLRFLRAIDRSVRDELGASSSPLVLAGDTSLLAAYRSVNQYANLLTETVTGNPDSKSAINLHKQAWPLVRQELDQQAQETHSRIRQAAARGQGTDNPAQIVHAALEGRVAALFVDPRGHLWGRFNPDPVNVQVLPEFEKGSEDLKNLAAVLTMRTGGTVTVGSSGPGTQGDTSNQPTRLVAQFRY